MVANKNGVSPQNNTNNSGCDKCQQKYQRQRQINIALRKALNTLPPTTRQQIINTAKGIFKQSNPTTPSGVAAANRPQKESSILGEIFGESSL